MNTFRKDTQTRLVPQSVNVVIDNNPVEIAAGISVAAALLQQGIRSWRHTRKEGKPRGLYCGIGACFDCLITIDEQPNQRACMAEVYEGMSISTYRSQQLQGEEVTDEE